MKAWKGFVFGVMFMGLLGAIHLKLIARSPDWNPFFVYQTVRNLRLLTTIKGFNGEIGKIYRESTTYPPDKKALLALLRQRNPELASIGAEIPFAYQSDGESYLLFWAKGNPRNLARDVFLVYNGNFYFTLERLVENEVIPAYQNRAVTPDPAELSTR